MNTVTLTIPDERPVSWNTWYSGRHWTVRDREARRVHAAVRAAIDPDQASIFPGLVDVAVTVFFASQPQDADNVAAKPYIDGLKGWYLEDDDGRHVRSVTTTAEEDPQNPRIVITIKSVQED